jgi:hypothetical protein
MTPTPAPAPKGKSKEEMLREEVRFYSDMMQKYLQWGLTVMVSVQTAIFFVRRDLVQTYIDAGVIKKGQELPYYRYIVGTIFILGCALVLSKFNARVANQYRHYKRQLVSAADSGIDDQPITGMSKWGGYLFFAFPIYDILVRLWVEIKFH